MWGMKASKKKKKKKKKTVKMNYPRGIKNMRMTAVRFQGKHTRFEYNSDDDEVVVVGGEEDEAGEKKL
ncbi:hypothetical protein SAY86_031213 [Trapa natans]|uniref:Uncharacterized protein n=1 Tax=Trapa natans TaxID=22666 RepID=A0AAN7LRF0_TRANT|nr:hypothetical protein SAY86_031213 [Trapa natans]